MYRNKVYDSNIIANEVKQSGFCSKSEFSLSESEKGLSQSEFSLSKNEKGLSESEFSLSKSEKGLSKSEFSLSKNEKGLSEREKVINGKDSSGKVELIINYQ
jgi:hypothetical protein